MTIRGQRRAKTRVTWCKCERHTWLIRTPCAYNPSQIQVHPLENCAQLARRSPGVHSRHFTEQVPQFLVSPRGGAAPLLATTYSRKAIRSLSPFHLIVTGSGTEILFESYAISSGTGVCAPCSTRIMRYLQSLQAWGAERSALGGDCCNDV